MENNNMLLQPAENIVWRSDIDLKNHTVTVGYEDGTTQTLMLEGEAK